MRDCGTVWKRSKHKASYRRGSTQRDMSRLLQKYAPISQSLLYPNRSYYRKISMIPFADLSLLSVATANYNYWADPFRTRGRARLEISYQIIMIRIDNSTYNKNGGYSCNKLKNQCIPYITKLKTAHRY